MLRANSLAATIGGTHLFDSLSFTVNAGERLGVVGPNGCGKTTLLNILAGRLEPLAGSASLTPGISLAFLAQSDEPPPDVTAGDRYPALFGSTALETRLAEVAERMATATGHEAAALNDEYDRLLAAMASEPATGAGTAELVPSGLDPATPLALLSGGERQRLALANVLRANSDLLLLDEPTNHLDLDTIEWLQRYLASSGAAAVIVSHDRAFLDAVATQVLDLDLANGAPSVHAGGYSDFAETMRHRREKHWEDYRRQQREERALKEEISAIESRARGIENSTINFYVRKRARKVARRAVTLRSRIERQLDSQEHLDRPNKPPPRLEGKLQPGERAASTLVAASNLALGVGERTLFQGATFSVGRGERVALLGANGAGKSTLLRAILGQQDIAGGTLHVSGSAVVGTLPQDDTLLADARALTPVDWLRRECGLDSVAANNYVHRFLGSSAAAQTPIERLSYGERRRLLLSQLILGGANLLLLDEPTNHLDLPAREAFEDVFATYEGAAIVATHDRYFIEQFATRVLHIGVEKVVEETIEA